MSRALERCHSIEDLERLARRRLPRPVYDYLAGGADDEWTLQRNRRAFADFAIAPRILSDTSYVDMRTTLFGRTLEWPMLLAPTGLTSLFHPDAEPAVGRAATRSGAAYALSTLGTTRIEAFADTMAGMKLFQIYLFKDRGLTEEFVARAEAAGIDALILTVDTPVAGNRERDRRNGLSLPPRLTVASLLHFALHPGWSLPALRRRFDFANVSHRTDLLAKGSMSLFSYIDRQFDRSLTWRDVEWLAGHWRGPLAVKGVLTAADARLAVANGARGIILSNHGGRQLDGVPAPLDQLPAVADALSGSADIILDSGIRRGTDMLKALAMGATAVSVGRAYLFGLAAGGEAGVDRALALLKSEFERALILSGVPRLADIDQHAIQRAGTSCRSFHTCLAQP